MTKEVLLTIKGLQFNSENGNDTIEVITKGEYYEKNGKRYILYEEVMEGFEEKTRVTLKLGEGFLEVTKKGLTNVHMLFQEAKKSLTCYTTPFGEMLIGIQADKVEIKDTPGNIDIKVGYELEVNYEHLANCEIIIGIKPKDTKDFSIM